MSTGSSECEEDMTGCILEAKKCPILLTECESSGIYILDHPGASVKGSETTVRWFLRFRSL